MGELMAALVKYADSDSTKDPDSDEEKAGKGKKSEIRRGSNIIRRVKVAMVSAKLMAI